MEIITLINIFYSNYNGKIDYDGIYKINDLINDDFIKVNIIKICNKEKYSDTIDKLNTGKIKMMDYQGGTVGHSALKVIAEEYIKNRFQQNVCIEQNYFGRIPDIISYNKQIIFECGDTDPWKIIEYFRNDDNLQIFILPYAFEDQDGLNAYRFTKNIDNLKDILFNKYIDSLSDIKNIIELRK